MENGQQLKMLLTLLSCTWIVKEELEDSLSHTTGPLKNLEPQNQEILEFYVVQERLATDLSAPMLRKGL